MKKFFVLLAILVGPSYSYACCVCPTAPINAHVSSVGADIISRMVQEHVTTRRVVNENTNQIVSEAAKAIIKTFTMETMKQRNALVTAVMFGSQAERNTMLFLETARTKRDMEATPSACVTGEIPLTAMNASNSSKSFARAELTKMTDDIAAGAQSSSDVVLSNIANKKRNFKSAGSYTALDLGGSDSLGAIGAKTFSDAQVEDARSFIKDLFSSAKIQAGSGAADKGKAITQKSMLSVMLSAFTDDLARKSPVDALSKNLKSGGFSGLLNSDVGKSLVNNSGGLSWEALLSADVDRRYMDPTWYSNIAGLSSPVSLAKEQLYMQATNLKLQHELLESVRKLEQQTALNSLIQLQNNGGPSRSDMDRAFKGMAR